MQLAPPATSATFVRPTAFADQPATGPVPATRLLGWDEGPTDTAGLVTVRYHAVDDGRPTRFSVRNDPEFTGEQWYEVRGSMDDALRAARELAIAEGFTDDPEAGVFARTSVAVLAAGEGAWHLSRMAYPEGLGDGLDAIISMPIDRFPAERSDVSVPFMGTPSRVGVRFDDDRVTALVGREHYALNPAG